MTFFPVNLIREPLVHFFAIGLLVFIFFGREEPVTTTLESQTISVTEAQMAQLSAQFEAAWRRPPTEEERAGLVEDFVRDEIYYREALALGLDRGDEIIRRRLRQKMEFLGDGSVAAPDEEVLRKHHAAHPDRFTTAARLTFRQVALEDEADAQAVRRAIADGADPQDLGRAGLLPNAIEAASEGAVDGVFGAGFFAQVERLTPGEWQGPVQSGYGPHLVQVTAFKGGGMAPFETVRGRVLEDWQRETAEAFRAAQFEALRSRYEVILPGDSE